MPTKISYTSPLREQSLLKPGRTVPLLLTWPPLLPWGPTRPWLSPSITLLPGSRGHLSTSRTPFLSPGPHLPGSRAFVYHCLCQAGDFKLPFLKDAYYIKKCFKCLGVFCSSLLHKSDINSQGRALLSAITEGVSGMKAVWSLLMFPNYRPFGSKRKR